MSDQQSRFESVEAIRWVNGQLELLDQRLLPEQERYLKIETAGAAADAIRDLVVRGAPAIGITAAYAAVLAMRKSAGDQSTAETDLDLLEQARPTAVNLRWAVQRMRLAIRDGADVDALERLAVEIHQSDIKNNLTMGKLGAGLVSTNSSVLTHCNAGALATGGYGTALGVIRSAFDAGKIDQVYAGETRPWLQGARLTAWELLRDGIPVTLVLEGAVACLFAQGRVDWLIVGADRIAANGDVANKIGTYSAALLARHHGVRVMVVAPRSTVDLNTPRGGEIPIEERGTDEVLGFGSCRTAAAGSQAWNPVFDITPNELIDAIVTEAGVAWPPYVEAIQALMQPDPR